LSDISIPGLSLAEQIAQLEEAAPAGTLDLHVKLHPIKLCIELDPEDLQNDADEPSTDLAAREHYLDVG
jgi:hypothetical protein